MSIGNSDKGNVQADTDACYEERASQEEIYLEETEEEVHEVLESDESSPPQNSTPCTTEIVDEPLDQAAKELITGDADDPPLSAEAVGEMLRVARRTRVA